MKPYLTLIVGLPFWVSCVHLDQRAATIPVLNHKSSLEECLDAGIVYGGGTLTDAKEVISAKNEWGKAGDELFTRLQTKCVEYDAQRMINGLHLYLSSHHSKAVELFKALANNKKGLCQPMAWHLAAAYRSPEMAQAIENRLSKAIIDNELDDLLQPKVAEALLLNRLKGSYTIAKHGLFTKNHDSFVQAMIGLNPDRASWDFMDYLSLATVEELRQLNIESVDVFSCSEIFQHMRAYPVALNHPKFSHLFFYAVSRNPAFSENARKLLEQYLPRHGDYLAQLLTRLPTWVQIAFVDASRRDMNPKLSLFLASVKKSSGDKDVIEEIDSVL